MKRISTRLYGGIEAGGTKFVCAVGTGPNDLRARKHFLTTTPVETIREAIDFFQTHTGREPLAAIGIASFGPLDLNPKSGTYGHITQTPKGGWTNTNLAGAIRNVLGIPVAIDTDVNGASLGEQKWGAAQWLDTFIYLTIGTGIGGGGIMKNPNLLPAIRKEVKELLNNYLSSPEILEKIDHYIVPPGLGVCPES